MRYVRRGAVLLWVVSLVVVVSLWMPIWPGSIEVLGSTYGRDEQTGHLVLTGGYHKRIPTTTAVPFWESDCYRWFKAHDFNLLLLVP